MGCLLHMLGGSKAVVMCSLTTAYSRFGVKKREKETENKDKSEMDKTHIHCNTHPDSGHRETL